jgi:HAD superfamily hydrolase (TIGR01549 family)
VIRVVLIDVDNTLLDFDGYVKFAMKTGFEQFGFIKYEDWMYDEFCVINHGYWSAYEKGEVSYEYILNNRWDSVFEKLGIVGDGVAFEKFFKGTLFNNAILINGAIDALKYLSGKYVVCTATNGPFEQQKNRLEISGINKFTTIDFISEQMGVQKPKKEFFDYAINELNAYFKSRGENELSKDEIIMIGDSASSDINGAKNSGIKACYFDKNKVGKIPQNADYSIDDWLQINRIL